MFPHHGNQQSKSTPGLIQIRKTLNQNLSSCLVHSNCCASFIFFYIKTGGHEIKLKYKFALPVSSPSLLHQWYPCWLWTQLLRPESLIWSLPSQSCCFLEESVSLICWQTDCYFFLQHCTEGRSDIMLFAVGFLPHPPPLLKLIIKCNARDKLFLGAEKLWSF